MILFWGLDTEKALMFHGKAFSCAPGMGDNYRVKVPNAP